MNRKLTALSFGLVGLVAAASQTLAQESHAISLKAIGTYASGNFEVGSAEIAAHDPATQRLFVINAQAATVDVLSIVTPESPTKIGTIDVTRYGAVANSVAVRGGIVAVAVESSPKTDPGKVVFFDTDLNFLSSVQVGALPDMLTFSPNGKYVLVANEGEPNLSYSIDPEGSVSIIDLSGGAAKLKQSSVRTADFKAYNNATLSPSVRIFGPGASVAQDLEPEYITVSQDSKTAWVTLQENNAIATIDIPSAKVTSIAGLGFKDHSAVVSSTAEIYPFDPASMPSIGSTAAGQEMFLGGFSSLFFEGIDPTTGRYKFVSNTDRGPNAEPTGILRPFLLPDFTPQIIRFELDRKSGAITITQRIPLQRGPGEPLTGLPNTALSSSPNQPYNDEVPVDLLGNVLPLDPLGADLEGIVVDPVDGSFWMVDEYRPAIYHFDSLGTLIQRYVPIGTAAAAGELPGTFGVEALPAVLAQRRQNRGFEGIALDGGKIYAFVQSPVRNPVSLGNNALTEMRNVRIVEFNPVTLATKQYIYVMDNLDLGQGTNTRADKIGDAVSLGNGEFLVVERDDDSLPDDKPEQIEKKVYRFNLTGATDVSSITGNVGTTGKTVDQLNVAEMVANGIRPVFKMLHVDLNKAGYNRVQKVEGLAVIDPWTIAVINDNDFGVANITINPDGTFTRNYVPELTQLGLIEVFLNGLDASDSDSKINIRQWPVKGMYEPDGIANYKVGNETFLVMANEGDAREYDTFVEAVRLGNASVVLDADAFPNPAVLKNNANLGRLNITTTLGRDAVTGKYKELYCFGGRSFSIRRTSGELVYDSGDDFEWITASDYPSNFNASNANNTFDNRSDDKGPEPEGVVIGKAYGREYAFIGLERIGGVMVYDISDPYKPSFVDYVNYREFTTPFSFPLSKDLGPEGLLFIKADDSPNGNPLLVIANEISGTSTVFEINKAD